MVCLFFSFFYIYLSLNYLLANTYHQWHWGSVQVLASSSLHTAVETSAASALLVIHLSWMTSNSLVLDFHSLTSQSHQKPTVVTSQLNCIYNMLKDLYIYLGIFKIIENMVNEAIGQLYILPDRAHSIILSSINVLY